MENCDSIVKSVLNKFIERAKMGKEKYNTDLDRPIRSIRLTRSRRTYDAVLYGKLKLIIIKKKK